MGECAVAGPCVSRTGGSAIAPTRIPVPGPLVTARATRGPGIAIVEH